MPIIDSIENEILGRVVSLIAASSKLQASVCGFIDSLSTLFSHLISLDPMCMTSTNRCVGGDENAV